MPSRAVPRFWLFVVVVVLAASSGTARTAGDDTTVAGLVGHSDAGDVAWQEVAVVPEKRSPGAMVIADGRILLWGGTTHAADAAMWVAPKDFVGYPPGYQGFFGDARVDGAIYDPTTGEWTPIPDAPLPYVSQPFAAWTGTELLIWGHEYAFPSGPPPTTRGPVGARYDPKESQWRVMAPQHHVLYGEAAWTGTRLVVVGTGADHRLHAASYDPARDEWLELSDPPLATANVGSVHALDDDRVIAANDAAVAVYVDGGWLPAAVSPFANRSGTSFASTGSELLQYGGGVADGDMVPPRGGGVVYDPTSDSWRAVEGAPPTSFGAPGPPGHVVAGGDDAAFFLGRPGLWRYSSTTGRWTALPEPAGHLGLVAVSRNDMWAIQGRSTPPGEVFSDSFLMRLTMR